MTELAALNVRITGDSGGLVAAVGAADGAITSFGRVTTAAQANARGFDRTLRNAGGAATAMQRQINSLTGVMANNRKSAQASANAFDRLGNEATQTATQLGNAGNRARTYSTQAFKASAQTANLGAQFNDIGVMLAAGQSPLMLAVQQGTQINQVLGQMGSGRQRLQALGGAFTSLISPANLATFAIIAGGAALVQWGMSALNAKSDGDSLADTMEAIDRIQSDLNSANEILRMSVYELTVQYGTYADEVLRAAESMAILAQAEAQQRMGEALADIESTLRGLTSSGRLFDTAMTTALNNIRERFGVTSSEALRLNELFQQLETATTFEQQVEALRQLEAFMAQTGVNAADLPPELIAALQQLNQMVIATASLEGALDSAAEAGANLRRSLPQTTGAIGPGLFSSDGSIVLPPSAPSDDGGSGGGISLADQIQSELEQLRQGFMTQEELQLEAYANQQELLQQALDMRLITMQEYHDLMEDAQRQHQDRMSDIDVYRYGTGLQVAGQFMGDMASALQSGNDRMAKIARVFAAGETLVNAWRAYSQVLADPSLPFFAKIPAALSVLSAGMGAVNAIKGAGGGGGSSGAATAQVAGGGATAAPPQVSRNVAIQLTGGDLYSRDQVVNLINSINEAVEDGAIVRLAP